MAGAQMYEPVYQTFFDFKNFKCREKLGNLGNLLIAEN